MTDHDDWRIRMRGENSRISFVKPHENCASVAEIDMTVSMLAVLVVVLSILICSFIQSGQCSRRAQGPKACASTSTREIMASEELEDNGGASHHCSNGRTSPESKIEYFLYVHISLNFGYLPINSAFSDHKRF